MSLIENRYDSLLARETLEEAQDGHDTQIIGDLLIDQEGALSYVTISYTFGKALPKATHNFDDLILEHYLVVPREGGGRRAPNSLSCEREATGRIILFTLIITSLKG